MIGLGMVKRYVGVEDDDIDWRAGVAIYGRNKEEADAWERMVRTAVDKAMLETAHFGELAQRCKIVQCFEELASSYPRRIRLELPPKEPEPVIVVPEKDEIDVIVQSSKDMAEVVNRSVRARGRG